MVLIMKKTIYNTIKMVAIAAVVMSSVFSCVKEEEVKTPVFPELVTRNDVVPGEELTLTFTPNMDWTVSISDEGVNSFHFKDGRFEVSTMSGQADGQPVNLTIGTSEDKSFSLRSCEISLTMGGRTEKIAKYMIVAEARVVEVYAPAKTEDGFQTEDGKYVYSDALTENSVIELLWDETARKYYFPIMIRSNFEWEVSWPEWARTDITATSRIGELGLEVYGISSKLPLSKAKGTISFKNGDEVLMSFSAAIPSSEDKFAFNLSGYTSLTFDHASYFHSGSGSYTKDPVQGYIYGPSASRVLLFEYVDGAYALPAGTSWVNLSVTPWNAVSGADVLQEREVAVTVPRYAGSESREAAIIFVPATAPLEANDLLTADKTQFKEEYASNVVTILQQGRPSEYITFEGDMSTFEEVGILFEKSSQNLLPEKNFKYATGSEDWQYNLSYVKELASSKAALYLTESYDKIEIYDAAGNLVTENLSEHWLSYSQMGEGLYGQVNMDATKIENGEAIDGYIVFKDVDGTVLSIVHCFYVPEVKTEEDVYEDASNEVFVDPSLAQAEGVTVYKVVSGPTYEQFKEHQAPIYILTYKKDNTSLEIKTSKNATNYSALSMDAKGQTLVLNNGPVMVTVDEQIFYDYEYEEMCKKYLEEHPDDMSNYPQPDQYDRSTMGFLRFGTSALDPTRKYPGYSSIRMKMPEGSSGVYREVIQFVGGSSYSTMMLFLCVLDLSVSAN